MNQYPLIKINLLFVCGIIIQDMIDAHPWLLAAVFLILLLTSACVYYLKLAKSALMILLLLVITAGSLAYYYSSSQLKHYPFKETKIENVLLHGSITNLQLPGSNVLAFTLEADSAIVNSRTYKLDHKILCRIRTSRYAEKNSSEPEPEINEIKSLARKLVPGNIIFIKGTLTRAAGQRNPGGFDYYNYLFNQNINALFTTYEPDSLIVTNNEPDIISRYIYSARLGLSGSIERLLNNDASSLLKGLILSDRSGIDTDIIGDFINTGVIHILSVSGLHIGYIVLMFIFLTGRINFIYRIPLIVAGIIIYTAVAGAPPSVVRASLMTIIIFAALLTNRSISLLNSISLACLITLLINPMELFHPGFQLSYAAVGGIGLFYFYFGDYFKKLAVRHKNISRISVFLLISLFAQIATLPLTTFYFGKISLVSLLLNILVIPAVGIILGTGIFMLVLSLFWTWGAMIYAAAINFLVYLLYSGVHYVSSYEWSYVSVSSFSMLDGFIFYLFMMIILALISGPGSLRFRIISGLLIISVFFIFSTFEENALLPDGKLSVLAVDVGQGDCFLIKFPDGTTALIDAGNSTDFIDNGRQVIMPLMERLGIEKIDYGFISHMDDDHYRGFVSLIQNNLLDRVYKPSPDKEFEKDILFEKWLNSKNIPIIHYQKEIIKAGNSRIYIPDKPQNAGLNLNDRSGVLKIVYGNTSVLFMGDTEKRGEALLISDYGSFLKSDILKLGHHGSKGGTSPEFLNAVQPQYALISAGRNNSFNHPSPETLERLRERKIKELRTDLNGAVLLVSDGEKFEVIDWQK